MFDRSKITKISQSDFNKIHADHQKWLQNNKKGKRAEFINCEFECDSHDFDFPEPYELSNCKIINCDFESVDISNLNFSNSEISNSTFLSSNTSDTNFSNSVILECIFDDGVDESANFKNCTIIGCIYSVDDLDINKTFKESVEKTNKKLLTLLTKETNSPEQVEKPNGNKNKKQSTLTQTGILPISEQTGILEFFKNSIGTGIQLSIGNRVSKTLNVHVKNALKKSKVPQEILDREIVSIALSIIVPQLLKLIVPFIPKLKDNDYALKAIDLACVSSATNASTEVFEYIVEFTTPIVEPFIKSLNSPQLKGELKKVMSAKS